MLKIVMFFQFFSDSFRQFPTVSRLELSGESIFGFQSCTTLNMLKIVMFFQCFSDSFRPFSDSFEVSGHKDKNNTQVLNSSRFRF